MVYKIFLTLGVLLFLSACDEKKREVSHTLTFKSVKEVKKESQKKSSIISLAMSGNVYLAGKDDANVYVQTIDAKGVHKNIALLNEANSKKYGQILDIDKNYIVIGEEPSPDTFFVYKIEANSGVKKLAKVTPKKSSGSKSMAGDIVISEDTIAVSELYSTLDERNMQESFDEKVLLYKINSDTNVVQTQEIRSERVDANQSTNFGASLALNSDVLAISDACYINLYVKDENGTFVKTDSQLVDASYENDKCYLSLVLGENYLVAQSQNYRTLYLYQVKDGKFKSSQEMEDEILPRNLDKRMLLKENLLILSSESGLTLYNMESNVSVENNSSIEDNNSTIIVNRYMDIEISAELLTASENYFIVANSYSTEMDSLLKLSPFGKIFVSPNEEEKFHIDTNETYKMSAIAVTTPKVTDLVAFDFNNFVDANVDNNYSLSLKRSNTELEGSSLELTVKLNKIKREEKDGDNRDR